MLDAVTDSAVDTVFAGPSNHLSARQNNMNAPMSSAGQNVTALIDALAAVGPYKTLAGLLKQYANASGVSAESVLPCLHALVAKPSAANTGLGIFQYAVEEHYPPRTHGRSLWQAR